MRALTRHGASTEQAMSITELLTAAERDGCHSHGLHRLEAFVDGCKLVNKTAVPEVKDIAPAAVVVDGHGGFQPYAQDLGMPSLQSKTRENGVAMLAVTNTAGMSGAMWGVAETLATDGLVSLVFANSPQYLAAHGGKSRVFGTNPMGFGWPRGQGSPPLVWDQASAAMARGEIELLKAKGGTLASGIGIGPDGDPSTVPTEVLEGCQLPFGGHKGSNIALMVELLGAALIGAHLAVDHPPHTPFDKINRGLFVIAIDPDTFATIGANPAERLFEAILDSSPGGRLPSQRRYEHRREVLEHGKLIEIPADTYATCIRLAEGDTTADSRSKL